MFCVNIRISPETAKKYGLTEDSVFEVFYDAPVLKVRQLNEEEIDDRTVQQRYDSWYAMSERMRAYYERLNALLGKEADDNE